MRFTTLLPVIAAFASVAIAAPIDNAPIQKRGEVGFWLARLFRHPPQASCSYDNKREFTLLYNERPHDWHDNVAAVGHWKDAFTAPDKKLVLSGDIIAENAGWLGFFSTWKWEMKVNVPDVHDITDDERHKYGNGTLEVTAGRVEGIFDEQLHLGHPIKCEHKK